MAPRAREWWESDVPNASTRVLLVEDEALDALEVARSLRAQEDGRHRFDVRCARTLAQGLEQLDGVDVVLLDLCLPDSEAAQTIARIRACSASTPVVVFSGCDDAELTARALEAGADDFVVKGDLDAGHLRGTLRRAVERRGAHRAPGPTFPPHRGDADRALLHHLKNVQTCILGNAQILQRELPDGGFLRERVDALVGAARDAADLLRQLAASTDDGADLVELSSLVRRTEPLLRAVVPDEIGLRLCLATALPPVAAYADGLGRALLELVVNASEAMDGGPGHIDVATGHAVLAASEIGSLVAPARIGAGPCVWLEVRDDGPGLDPGARERLFERGYSTKGGGRGHGLSEAREIVARHAGGLRVSSRPGTGTAFRILLPLRGLS
jgi:signal transduction histidine kinase